MIPPAAAAMLALDEVWIIFYLSLMVSFNLQPGKEGGEGEGEHDGGDGVGEHEAEHQAGVRVLQDVSVLEQADYWIWKIYFTSTFKTDIQREDKYIGDH